MNKIYVAGEFKDATRFYLNLSVLELYSLITYITYRMITNSSTGPDHHGLDIVSNIRK
jgi:hypothetical protein